MTEAAEVLFKEGDTVKLGPNVDEDMVEEIGNGPLLVVEVREIPEGHCACGQHDIKDDHKHCDLKETLRQKYDCTQFLTLGKPEDGGEPLFLEILPDVPVEIPNGMLVPAEA